MFSVTCEQGRSVYKYPSMVRKEEWVASDIAVAYDDHLSRLIPWHTSPTPNSRPPTYMDTLFSLFRLDMKFGVVHAPYAEVVDARVPLVRRRHEFISCIPETTLYTPETVIEGKQWIQGTTKPPPSPKPTSSTTYDTKLPPQVYPVPRCIETRKNIDLRCHEIDSEKNKPYEKDFNKPVLEARDFECTSPRLAHDAYLKAIYNILDISLISRYERDDSLSSKGLQCVFDHAKLYNHWPLNYKPIHRSKACWKLTTRDGVQSIMCDLCYTAIMFSPVWDTVRNSQSEFETAFGFRFCYPRLMHPSELYRRARGGTPWPLQTLAKKAFMSSELYDSVVDLVETMRRERATETHPYVSPRQCDKKGRDVRPTYLSGQDIMDVMSTYKLSKHEPDSDSDNSDAETVCYFETQASPAEIQQVKAYWDWCEITGLEYDAFALLDPPWESELAIGTFGQDNNFLHIVFGHFLLQERRVLVSIKKKEVVTLRKLSCLWTSCPT